MALMKEQIDLLLNMKTKEFFNANKRAIKQYEKTKKGIEGKPIRLKETGGAQMLKRIASIGIAYIGLRKVVDDLRQSQTNLAAVESLGAKNIDELRKGVVKLGLDIASPLHEMETALYEVVSAEVAMNEQMKVLEASSKAAVAGQGEVIAAFKTGSTLIKGMGKEWSEFDDVMDAVFLTIKLGQTNLTDLGANLGKVVPLANKLKISSDELLASFATLTGVTGNTAEVATQIRGIFAATIKPTAELTKLFKEYGGASAALKQLGMAEYLKQIAVSTKGNDEEMGKLIPRVEGLSAVLSLANEQYDTFVRKTAEYTNKAGAANEAYSKQADTLDSKLIKLDNSFQVLSQSVLTMFVPAITSILDVGGDLFRWFAELDDGTKKAVLTFGAFALAAWKVPKAINAIRISVAALQVSMGPAGWLILGLGALASAWFLFSDSVEDSTVKIIDANKSLNELNQSIKAFIEREYETDNLDRLIERRAFYNEKVDESINKLEKFNAKSAPEGMIKNQEQMIRNYQATVKTLDYLIKKRREFEDAMKETPGGDIGGLKLAPPDTSGIDNLHAEIKTKTEELYLYLSDVEMFFNEQSYESLQMEYTQRTDMLNRNLLDIVDAYGIESKEYQKMMDAKLQMDRSYQGAKRTLEIQGAQASVQLMSQFMSAFQGQSETLFKTGQLAALAMASINMYESATTNLKAYPLPWGAIAAAAAVALGLAQITKIANTTFSPAGKKEGGEITLSDVAPSMFTPRGEDGLIGVQVGETIMNRGASDEFAKELAYMNKAGTRRAQYPVPGYAEGGTVTDVASVSASLDPEVFGSVIENSIKKGFDRSKLRVEGQFKAKGQDLESAIDKRESLKSQA